MFNELQANTDHAAEVRSLAIEFGFEDAAE